jgi:hypothetical protein
MIAFFSKWFRRLLRVKPYDPLTDPVWRSLNEAKIEGRIRAAETQTDRRINKLESVYLHRRVEKQDGGPYG